MKHYRYLVETLDHDFQAYDYAAPSDLEARLHCFEWFANHPFVLSLTLFRYKSGVGSSAMILTDKISRPLSIHF